MSDEAAVPINPLFGDAVDPQKLWATVESVWHLRHHLGDVVQFVVNHRERLVHYMDQVPTLLSSAGEAIHGAGEAATRAATFLTCDGSDESVTAQGITALAGDALDTCRDELAHVSQMIATVAEAVGSVHIPDLDLKYSQVAGFQVVSGVHVGSRPLAGGIAEHLSGGVARLEAITTALTTVAERIRSVGVALSGLGSDLNQVGQHLTTSGGTLRGLLDDRPAVGEDRISGLATVFDEAVEPRDEAA